MSAPTSVKATRLMRLQRLPFRSVNLPLAMPEFTPILAQSQPSSRDPLAGERGHARPNSQSQSRVARRPADGGWAASCEVRATGRGSSSSEYSSTATVPPPPPSSR